MINKISQCAENPLIGKSLSGDLQDYYSFHFSFKGVQYRIIYTIDHQQKIITVEIADTRENIYKKLKRKI